MQAILKMTATYLVDEPGKLGPEDEILPGVKWGRSSWIASPAFWYAIARNSEQENNYAAPIGTTLREVVTFCILGGYAITAEINHAAFERLVDSGALREGQVPSEAKIEALLRVPLLVSDRLVRYRFPKQKAERLSAALAGLDRLQYQLHEACKIRDLLMDLRGIGPKTASWIVRNWLGSDEVAILDVHILRVGRFMGLFPANAALPKDYEFLEQRFLEFADRLDVRASLLDAIIWREARLLPTKYLCANA